MKKVLLHISLWTIAGAGVLGPFIAHAQYYPQGAYPQSLAPYQQYQQPIQAIQEITGIVVRNMGAALIVRTHTGEIKTIRITPYTRITDINHSTLGLYTLSLGTRIRSVGFPSGDGITAQTIVLIGPLFTPSYNQYPYGYPYQGPVIVQPFEFMYPWHMFVQRHPHDWWRWRRHWEERQPDRDRRDRERDRRPGSGNDGGAQGWDWRDRTGNDRDHHVTPHTARHPNPRDRD